MIRNGERSAWLLLAAVSCGTLVACDDLVPNHDFQQWCGEELCDWTLVEGSYERVSTWHVDEYGVSFTGDPTAIEQDVDAGPSTVECMRFEVITYVGADAEVRLELDFDADGIGVLERTLERANWERVEFYVRPPDVYELFRLRVVKYGSGEAILAMMRVREVPASEGCVGPSPIPSSAPVSEATSP